MGEPGADVVWLHLPAWHRQGQMLGGATRAERPLLRGHQAPVLALPRGPRAARAACRPPPSPAPSEWLLSLCQGPGHSVSCCCSPQGLLASGMEPGPCPQGDWTAPQSWPVRGVGEGSGAGGALEVQPKPHCAQGREGGCGPLRPKGQDSSEAGARAGALRTGQPRDPRRVSAVQTVSPRPGQVPQPSPHGFGPSAHATSHF